MNRTLSNLAPHLLLAAGILLSTGLAVAAPHLVWAAFAVPLLLVLALLGADLLARRRLRPSPSALLMAAAILVASGIVGASDPHQVALMIPVFGGCAAMPILSRRKNARAACRLA